MDTMIGSAKSGTSEERGALTLFDIAVAESGGQVCANRVRIVRTIDAVTATSAEMLAASSGWDRDTCYAAAWAIVRCRVLGEEEGVFYAWDQVGSNPGRLTISAHCIPVGITSRSWLDLFSKDRKQIHNPTDSKQLTDRVDHLWLSQGFTASTHQSGDALVLGLDFGASSQLTIEFSEAVFARSIVEALLDSMLLVLASLLQSPEVAVASIEMLGEDQKSLLLSVWNRPPQQYAPSLTVDALFAASAVAHSDRVALAWPGGAMTYRELEIRSNVVAQRLLTAGAKGGSVIGVALNRSPEAIMTLLGILKMGSAYLPVDLKYPSDRISFLLEDAGAALVIAHTGSRQLIPSGITVVDVSELTTLGSGIDVAPVNQCTGGDAVAYVMYTSGSTGEPKGIEICHRSIVRLVHKVEYVNFGSDCVVLHAAPLGFDASTFEIWGALLNGGKCVLHDEVVPTGPGLARSIQEHRVTTAWLTAALFNAIVDEDPLYLKGIDQLLTGGEALSVSHITRAQKALPDTTLINGYGPTECTTFTATYRIPAGIDPGIRSIPIGRPISETSVYIVNQHLELVPIGIVGELCVGGKGLARGYLNRPELSEERFVANPYGAAGEKLYRTGDLVRYLPDGNIEFIGRRDGQVKVRGFRIELGEIEAALMCHAGVKTCAVIAREDQPGNMRLVAYVVPAGNPVTTIELKAHLTELLPDFMVPAVYVPLTELPVTANGKLDRRGLPVPENRRPELVQPYSAPITGTEDQVCRIFAEVLCLDRVGRLDNFFELGGSSLLVMRAISHLQKETNQLIPTTAFFNSPTPFAVANILDGAIEHEIPTSRLVRPCSIDDHGTNEAIAIVAFAGRFPGAADVEMLWENLCGNQESITFFRLDQIDQSIPSSVREDPSYVRARGVIDDVDMFDASFFGITPKEAELMDPQQRIFLELCWECLERGGYAPDTCPVPVGVFGGMYNASYFQRHVAGYPEKINRLGEFQVMLSNEKDYVTTRVANRLNLTGPAVSVHTACSTSLVAIVQAMINLRSGQCGMALAGGASITCPPNSGYLYQEGSMLSPDGHTRSFDSEAQGTVFSDGAAVVLLKRLSDALADGDPIYAVMLGGASNNDGGNKASFTAPSVDGQAAVIAAALDNAGVDARSISYVETHGTATPLGDPVEIEALTKAYRRHTDDIGFCRIGSVKSNLGHLVIAAGATGVIKTALALSKGRLPASMHFKSPNPKLNLSESPFIVNAEQFEWQQGDIPRRAGVSAFGVGGTNAHVILEEAPAREASEQAAGPLLLQISAKTPAALLTAEQRLAAHIEANPSINLADVAYTLRIGRKTFVHRSCVVASSATQAVEQLRDAGSPLKVSSTVEATVPSIVFMFPGQGAQYASMGKMLYESEPIFRDAFDVCLDALEGVLEFNLKQRIFSGDAAALMATETTQPALFCIEYALAKFWLSLGIRPTALLGHSVGEFVAATLAGVFQVDDAVRMVARRGQLMQALPSGAMLAVRSSVTKVLPHLGQQISLAAENSPGLCVVAGPHDSIEALRVELEKAGVVSRLLQTSHAFHSSMMEPAVAPFEAEMRKIKLSVPSIPIYSTVTGKRLTDDEARDPGYWASHLREPVRFSPALISALDDVPGVFLEIGPRAILTTLSRQHSRQGHPAPLAMQSLADTVEGEQENLLLTIGRLWSIGVHLQLETLDRRNHKLRVLLPTYPFERQRYWLDAKPTSVQPLPVATVSETSVQPSQPELSMSTNSISSPVTQTRIPELLAQLGSIIEDTSGVDVSSASPTTPFVELGLDSLSLTQFAIQLKQTFKVNITFRQLMEKYRSLDSLASFLDGEIPVVVSAAPATPAAPLLPVLQPSPMIATMQPMTTTMMPVDMSGGSFLHQVIQQQMQLMANQLALLAGSTPVPVPQAASPAPVITHASSTMPAFAAQVTPSSGTVQPLGIMAMPEDASATENAKYDVKKAFGAIARIHTSGTDLTERQRARLDAFMRRYIERTKKSKAYTVEHRPHMADPRVVNGFRPALKEIIYQIVIERSKGSHMWDLDGNEYVDALSGFGMSLFGWQPDFVLSEIRKQLDSGYDIGPMHPLAGEVSKLFCEVTGNDRAALCNTGSEAVMGCVRIARTVTGRSKIAIFNGAYHGIFDEVIVRGTKKLKSIPAAPGIMPNTSENVLVLDYGTPESLQILKDRAHELAAILVEPVQSRRPDFQPREFLRELRTLTEQSGTVLIFDEVVTGFRSHPGGTQALFGIRADLASYGKVVGGGFPIGVIAGKREFMDALDGGQWQYGDDSIPTVGVTYFAGTFVRHPLALVAAKAVLEHVKREGPEMQAALTRSTAAMVDELNAFCREVGAPIVLKSFSSVWKIFFTEDHQMQDLLFAMMRSRGVHILDNFPCFLTTAHTPADIAVIKSAFKEAVAELQEAEFLPRKPVAESVSFDAARPPVPGARLGRDADGKPAWFVANPDAPGKYIKVEMQ